MTKYDELDPRKELEQIISKDLEQALKKRGFTVVHQGTPDSNAPGDKTDIIAFDNDTHINIEVTQTTKSSSDREFLSIKDHLEKAKKTNSRKKCFMIYCSPETHYRMINAMRDYNILHGIDKDLKMIPLNFSNFEILINKLVTSHKDQYKKSELLSVFDHYKHFVDDERVLEILHNLLFADDDQLKKQIEIQEDNKHQKTAEELITKLLKLEDDLRNEKGITHIDAIRNIIFLVFCKLYEEKREFENKENRFKLESFKKYQEFQRQENKKRAIHDLFNNIKQDPDLVSAEVFTDNDNLAEKLDDDFVLKFFIEPFEKYHFFTTKIDGIGAAYEVLGMRTGKDVKAGQFFTPENVVKFMVKLAELEPEDKVLDPACGTARFLIYAMHDLTSKAPQRNKEDTIRKIRTQNLLGSDYDLNVAKLAKMNMYIHGDGKSNINSNDGLLLYDLDDKIDVILTNPPLGDQSYNKTDYDDDFKLNRMEIIPKQNITEKKKDEYKKKLEDLKIKLTVAIDKEKKNLEKRIKTYQAKIDSLETQIKSGKEEWETKGNQMKGGALFLGASKHYLKSIRDKTAPIEWRGGKILIILDEGILNTGVYNKVRDFITKYFYIKAIISLSRDTFVPVSSTSTKTSILYAVKKEDPDAIQQEPIFFVHAEKVGVDTKGHVCPNHLFDNGNDVLSKYFEFKTKVLASYSGLSFNKEKFQKQQFENGKINA